MTVTFRPLNDGEIQAYLQRHATSWHQYSNEIRFTPCPNCKCDDQKNPSTSVYDGMNDKKVKGFWYCHRCEASGNWHQLCKGFGYVPNNLFENSPSQSDYRVFAKLMENYRQKNPQKERRPVSRNHYPELLDYCLNRGLTKETLDKWKVSTKGSDLLRFPLYQAGDGIWHNVNCKIRRVFGKGTGEWFEIKDSNCSVLIGNHLLNSNGSKRFIITEGQWDAMSFTEIGFDNVFSLPHGTKSVSKVSDLLTYLPDDWEVWASFDDDESGNLALENLYARFDSNRIKTFNLPTNDLNQWLVENPKLTKDDVMACLKGSAIKSFIDKKESDGFLDLSIDDLMDEDDQDEKDKLVAITPYPELDKALYGGFRPYEVSSLLAPSGKGKSTFVKNLAIHAALNGTVVGMIDLEDEKRKFKKKLRQTIRGMLAQNNISYDDKSVSLLKTNLKISNLRDSGTTLQAVVDEVAKLAAIGVKLLFIDNLDFISSDERQKFNAFRACRKIVETSGCHIFFVWQPNKIDKSKIINSGDQKGFSRYLQDSQVYMNINQIGNYRVLHVEKNREKDPLEPLVWLSWCGDGVYKSLPEQPKDVIHPLDKRVQSNGSGNGHTSLDRNLFETIK